MTRFELEERLVEFTTCVIKLSKSFSNSFISEHLKKQLLRSSSSVALNYSESLGGESKKDFAHKMKLSLKELRESYTCLRIIRNAELNSDEQALDKIIKENDELIRIFVSSIKTSEANS